jgi:hypothetical protein
VVVAAAEEL